MVKINVASRQHKLNEVKRRLAALQDQAFLIDDDKLARHILQSSILTWRIVKGMENRRRR